MQVPGPFEYERATSVDHAIGLLDRLGDGAMLVAGGHSLLPMMKLRIANPEYLVDINDLIPELGYIVVGAGRPATSGIGAGRPATSGIGAGRPATSGIDPTLVRIGAMTRHREALESDELAAVCPIFRDAERVIADPVVRNRGTVGGSLCQADPAEDLTTVCTVLNAVCLARGPSGEREIPIDDFLAGPYETSLAHNEMLIEIRIPLRHNSSNAYAKVERRVGDWAVAAAGAAVTLDGDTIVTARLGLTAVNTDGDALAAVGAGLAGRPATEETFADAGRDAEQACSPVTDMRGSAEYKRHLANELTVRTLRSAVQRIRNAPAVEGN
ncbi:carbon monoxide dehydrogenase [Mycobacterium sp. ACS1612]|uniref:FAD binding domain-containing protein n=1 Tax=Mycobacterium sp. ACS1612 TaxID=1834117 RepID=UPI0007FD411E|nr:xanthine dehydrogenase family protein subunit M [Mycobacterium sp. ACS1612]OBF31483.1 carbon monoxide dehydrogenase [Mycobacterium sp. ACS1612]